ncbi:hypothetical protein [Prevotella sp. HJM029]|uniref:hypothetical protein n=1 Tax=Prevotella sp. HJM029 TaxID=1433844 RepID=UPI0004B54021|nr:hypothetical protein [Prevotella sp. HJM029]
MCQQPLFSTIPSFGYIGKHFVRPFHPIGNAGNPSFQTSHPIGYADTLSAQASPTDWHAGNG